MIPRQLAARRVIYMATLIRKTYLKLLKSMKSRHGTKNFYQKSQKVGKKKKVRVIFSFQFHKITQMFH